MEIRDRQVSPRTAKPPRPVPFPWGSRSASGERLLGFAATTTSRAMACRRGALAARSPRPARSRRSTTSRWRRRQVRGHLGIAHPYRPLSIPWIATWAAARDRPRVAPQSGRHAGRRRHELRAPPPGVRLLLGSLIDQTRYLSGVGYAATLIKTARSRSARIRIRSAGSISLKIRVDQRVEPGGKRRAHREEAVALHGADSARRRIRPDPDGSHWDCRSTNRRTSY